MSTRRPGGSRLMWVRSKATGRLAPYVGPIAKVMAKKAAAQARDLKAFYQRLAENLDPEDRARFLKDAGYEP